MNAIHVYPVTRSRPHVLSEDCWCEPTVEHVAASEPLPLPAPPPDEQPEDPDNDDAGDEPVTEGEP